MTAPIDLKPIAGHKAIRLAPDGSPRLEGVRCKACASVFADAVMACRSCGRRDQLQPFAAAQAGKLFSWSIIHRSYPGIPVPFVSAIVDLDGGMTIKGTLRGHDPRAMRVGLPVDVVFDDAGGARNADGAPYVGFHFVASGDTQ